MSLLKLVFDVFYNIKAFIWGELSHLSAGPPGRIVVMVTGRDLFLSSWVPPMGKRNALDLLTNVAIKTNILHVRSWETNAFSWHILHILSSESDRWLRAAGWRSFLSEGYVCTFSHSNSTYNYTFGTMWLALWIQQKYFTLIGPRLET